MKLLHVKKEARKEVHPREFWIAISLVAVLLCALGIYHIQTGHLPETPDWLLGIALGIVWAGAIVSLVRRRRDVFTAMYLVNLVGYSMFATAKLTPHWWNGIGSAGTVSWIGLAMVMIATLSQFIGVGKRQSAPETAEAEPERIAAR